MIIDLKKVTLGRQLADGALWVIEQIPGLVVGADQTTILRAGLLSAFLSAVQQTSSTVDSFIRHDTINVRYIA